MVERPTDRHRATPATWAERAHPERLSEEEETCADALRPVSSVNRVDEFVTRTYEESDATIVADLMNAVEAQAGGRASATAAKVTEYISHVVRDPGCNTRLVHRGDAELVAIATVATPSPGAVAIPLGGGVHPRWRSRGLGRELLGWQLARAREIHRSAAPEAAWEVHAGAMAVDTQTTRLFERFGMSPVRHWFDMVAPTVGVPEVDVPEGLRVVGYTVAHEVALHSAHMEAFADHWRFEHRSLERWAPLTVRSERFAPELTLLAFDGDAIAGYLLAYHDPDPYRLYIGQVGVRKPWRRRGLAAALLTAALSAAAGAGKTRAALGVDAASPTGAVGVYERAGFTVESRAVTYAIPLTRHTTTS
jgi:mycothiol synthase